MRNWPDEAFAAYVAAMIDGEGHIEVVRAHSVRVRIANTIRPTLDAMVERMGFGHVIEYKRPAGKNYKRLFCLEVSSIGDIKRLFDLCGRYIHMKPDQMAMAVAVVDRVLSESDRLDQRNRQILAKIKAGEIQAQIAKEFGVSPQLVSRIKKGHTWTSVITGHRSRELKKRFPRRADQSFRLHGEPNP